ncbi:unnamed protein product [Miscanthus lutarioriparius]|uniref:Signal recognition particle subunit SRP68 n=1 Tax=Miscanthus lutarioriparius TaxID=422564 RepID=A0A811N350_9POAL|nr:unnamed protein product [Miscanthus lutarioriparius]
MSKPADQQPSDMQVDSSSAVEEKPAIRFSINVLELMREAQMQHGLRQSDYTRYRRYCSARLRRLYKSLKFCMAEAYASYMKGALFFEQDKNIDAAMINFKNTRAIYEELGKYGSIENQLLCRQRIDELEPMIDFCSHKLGGSYLQAHELLETANDLLKAKMEAVLSETRSQQAASMTEFNWLGRTFPITNAKTRVSILKAQQLERDLSGAATESVAADKKLAIFDKIFSAYHDARSCIRNDLASAGNAEDIRDELNGLDKAVSAVLGLRTIERNQLLVSIAKSKFTKHRDEKNERITKPEELVRLYDLLIQLWKKQNEEENSFIHEYELKGLAFRAERCFFLAKSYSSAGKRAEAYALFCHARTLTDSALQQLANSNDKALIQDLKSLSDNCRSNSCIEHATGIMEEEIVPLKLSKGVSTMSLADDKTKENKYLLDMLESYESAIGEPNTKAPCHIAQFPPPFQAVPCNPIVLDMAYNAVEFPSLENRMKKEKKGLLSRFWG